MSTKFPPYINKYLVNLLVKSGKMMEEKITTWGEIAHKKVEAGAQHAVNKAHEHGGKIKQKYKDRRNRGNEQPHV